MSVMKLENYEEEYLLNKLKQEGDCPKSLLTIVKFAFLTCIQDLMGNLDSKFNSKNKQK